MRELQDNGVYPATNSIASRIATDDTAEHDGYELTPEERSAALRRISAYAKEAPQSSTTKHN